MAAYDPNQSLRVHLVSQSPHTFAYKLWQKKGETWSEIDAGNIKSPPKDFGPFPPGTKLAYTLLVGGNPGTDWRIQAFLSQMGLPCDCTPRPETGVVSAKGVA